MDNPETSTGPRNAQPYRPPPTSDAAERIDHRTLRRRQFRVLRSLFSTGLIAALLIALAIHNRDEATIRACESRMKTLAEYMQMQRDLRMPCPTTLPEPPANASDELRASLDTLESHAHYNPFFPQQALFGRPVGVCTCRWPHTRLLGTSGRWVMTFSQATGRYEVQWLDETEFTEVADDLGLRLLLP